MSSTHHSSVGGNAQAVTQTGQRAGAAEVLTQHRDELLRRIHARIGGSTRKITDTEDILSTVARRLDRLIADGRLEAGNERQLFALIHAITDRTLLEKHRMATRAQKRETTSVVGRRVEEAKGSGDGRIEPRALEKIVGMVTDPIDRQILDGKARGWSYGTLALELGISEDSVRQRWSRLRRKVQEALRGS